MRNLIVTFCLLFTVAGLWAQTYTVGTRNVTWTDAARSNRSVPVEIRYPGTNTTVASDSFPFVVFGHGFQMTGDNYYSIFDSLVKRGYIVLLAGTETSLSPSHPNFAQDFIFIYNKIISEGYTNSSSPFYGHVVAKGAIGGHSMGGGCTVLSSQYGTPATCYFTFAAATTNPSSIVAAPNLNKPYLAFAGSGDCIAPPATNQLPMYDSSNAPCKVYVNILNALHCQFGSGNFQCNFGEGFSGCASSSLSRTAQINKSLSFLVPYLDYYLKGNCAAWQQFEAVYAANSTDELRRSCTNTIPANPSVTGITAVCPGNSTTLTAQPSGFSYSWSNGTTTQANTVNAAGSYSVSVSNGVCAVNASATVTQNSGPSTPGPITMPDTVCDGIANIEIVTPVSLPGEYYLWTLPAGWSITSGDSTNVIYAVSGSTGGSVSVVIENACGASQPVTRNVTVVPSNLGAAGAITGPADLCPGQQVSYSINPVQGASSYVWTLPQGWSTTGSSNTTINATNGSAGGVVQVSAANNCGTSQPATLNITVTTVPVISTPVTGPAEVCAGQQAQYSVPAIAGADEYNWTLPAGWQLVSVADTNIITATAGTAGTLQVTAGNQCGTSSAAELSVTINTAPVVAGAIQGPDTICTGAGEGIYYVINPMPSAGNVYDWTLPAGWSFIGGDSTMSPIVNVTSSGTLSVVASNQCGSGTQLSYNVALVDTPVAQLTLSGTTLTASPTGAGYTYQWFLNDQLITGETGSTLQATGEGVYKVTVSNPWFCTSTATVNYVLGISGVSGAVWSIYPNPSTGLLHVVTDGGIQGGVIKILAADGRLVYNSLVSGTQTTIWLPEIPAGIYTISLQKGGAILHQKLVKQ
jgi:hypothetical protein